MIYSNFYKSKIRKLYIERGSEGSPHVVKAIERLDGVAMRVIEDVSEIPGADRTGTTLYVHAPRGAPVTRCPGTKGHRCCNYLTVELYSGCPIGCTYCIMRSYLNFAPVSIVSDTKPIADEIGRIALSNPDTMIRVGSGETGDSLYYDPLFELSMPIVESLAEYANVHFELKTKTAFVDHLVSVPRKGNAVIGFSLSPQPVVDAEEGRAASLEERLDAAWRASEAGYLVSFHFDPMFYDESWRERYLPVVGKLKRFAGVIDGRRRIAWISLGTFRFPDELKNKIAARPYMFAELVRSADGKYRYIQKFRSEMYREMRDAIRSIVSSPVYLCMESEAVWRRAFGNLPEALAEESPLFDWPDVVPTIRDTPPSI